MLKTLIVSGRYQLLFKPETEVRGVENTTDMILNSLTNL